MPLTENFFESLTPTNGLGAAKKQEVCVAVPENFFLFITDVKGSTEAIRAGKYRDVNVAGALCIMAIINSEYYRKIPFIFGGDGVMFLVPENALSLFSDLMCAVRQFTQAVLNMELRVGIVPIQTLYQAGKQLAIGKLSFGHGGCLAIFEGNGIEFAENLVKMPASDYLLPATHITHTEVNFEGFFCPFADIPSEQGNVMALIIKPMQMNWHDISKELFGYIGDENLHHPLDANALSINKTAHNIDLNAAVVSGKNSGFLYHLEQLVVKTKLLRLNRTAMKVKIAQAVRSNMMPASDYQKYDGNYKIVFRCSTETIERVIQWLTQHEQQGSFLFGYHLTNRSIMTCLFDGKGDDRELHLIDAADGGYALAAAMLKQKLYL
jgi:hypothetical protein